MEKRAAKSITRVYSIHAVTKQILACHGELSDAAINSAIEFYHERQRLANVQAVEIGQAPTAHEPIKIIVHRSKKPPHKVGAAPYLRNGVQHYFCVI